MRTATARRSHPPLQLAVNTPSWDGAACHDHDPELWFRDAANPDDRRIPAKLREQDVELAKAICAECPILGRCGDYTDAHPFETAFGIWAGRTAAERQATRPRSAACEQCGQPYRRHSKSQRYCADCSQAIRADGKRRYDRKRR